MSRPRVLLLHAFPLDCRMWAAQKRALEEAGWHVSAPDLPGPEAESSLADWAGRLLALSDGPLVPVGVSMGGYVAFELWRQARGRVAALVLADTRAGADTAEGRRGRDESIRLLEEEGVAALWERLEERLFAAGASLELVGRAREIALEQGATRLTAALAAMRDRRDAGELLGGIDVPALVVVGEEDRLTPASEAEALAAALPRGRLVRIPGAGHLSPLERPAEFSAALLSFLREVAA